ncbi:hypothetical protein ACRAWF_45830 [Streptomyces sp. L7]
MWWDRSISAAELRQLLLLVPPVGELGLDRERVGAGSAAAQQAQWPSGGLDALFEVCHRFLHVVAMRG